MSRHETSPSAVPRVIFVAVNWNQPDVTIDCLQSLGQQAYPSFDIVLVDNGSSDNSVPRIRAAFPGLTLIENGANLGIAAANNVGIRWALDHDADYVFLINNDTVVSPDALPLLIAVAESDPSVGIVGPTMLYFERPDTINCAGNQIDWRDASTTLLGDDMLYSTIQDDPPREVDFISTCAACIKRRVFADAGFMDERYFIYYDETDWFVRAARSGWRTLHVPKARIWHKVSSTMKAASPATTYYMVRNRLLFLTKHTQGLGRIGVLTRVLAQESRTLLAHTFKRRYRALDRQRRARWLGLRDAARGRFGPMGNDVAAVCFPARSN